MEMREQARPPRHDPISAFFKSMTQTAEGAEHAELRNFSAASAVVVATENSNSLQGPPSPESKALRLRTILPAGSAAVKILAPRQRCRRLHYSLPNNIYFLTKGTAFNSIQDLFGNSAIPSGSVDRVASRREKSRAQARLFLWARQSAFERCPRVQRTGIGVARGGARALRAFVNRHVQSGHRTTVPTVSRGSRR